ncbi:hypothetical protein L1987_06668 [Smallanthus sonchifolius]|uniref:Uncharacterized protein n=1 Tax=Smallanthus sonchifolius TaxID=185202 RepID=A0ACB9JYZ0_9ASTR|nr:hypothetical protein L1987_06668 [Smallanthus sonchifolius]
MMNPRLARNLLPFINRDLTSRFSYSPFTFHNNQHRFHRLQSHPFTPHNPNSSSSVFSHHSVNLSLKSSTSFEFSFASGSPYSTTTNAASEDLPRENPKKLAQPDTNDEVEPIDLWEDEDETEPQIGDGGDGGGVVLHNCPWGERVLSIAQDVLLQFGDDIEIFAFKTSPRGYIYVRLDRLCNEYGCPSMEDIQSYSHEYKKKLDEAGAVGDIPSDLALEVSSPGADRLLRIPDDLQRFKNMAMRVKYVEHDDPRSHGKEGIFFLESVETESGSCVWRLADVKENRDPSSKGRPLTRKQKDWRLKLPYEKLDQVTLYLDYQ